MSEEPQAGGAPGELALRLAVALVAGPAGVLLCAAAGFAAGRAVGAGDLAAGALLAGAAALAGPVRRRDARGLALGGAALLLAAGAVAGALALAGSRFDTSFDGQAYHQEAVLALAGGWNPLARPLGEADFPWFLFVNHFAKGSWTVEAALRALGGSLERAKALHGILAAGALAAALAALAALPLPRLAAAAGALVAAANPVAVTQLMTFYVDGQLASLLTAGVAFAALQVVRPRPLALAGLLAATVLLVNVKLSGPGYAALLWAGLALAAALRRGARRGAALGAAGAAAVLASALGPGFSPYVQNALREGHPLHPVAGPRRIDIMAGQYPPGFARASRAERLLRSTFSVASNDPAEPVRLKVPLTVVGDEATKFHAPDVRVGGFGPLFGGALLLALAALPFATRRAAARAGGAAAAVLASVLATGEGWWARYAPQLWLVPLMLALAPLAGPRLRGARLAGAVALAALAADAGLVAVNGFNRGSWEQWLVRKQLAELSRAREPVPARLGIFTAAGARLDEAGVRWRAVDELPCAAPVPLAATYGEARICPPAPAR